MQTVAGVGHPGNRTRSVKSLSGERHIGVWKALSLVCVCVTSSLLMSDRVHKPAHTPHLKQASTYTCVREKPFILSNRGKQCSHPIKLSQCDHWTYPLIFTIMALFILYSNWGAADTHRRTHTLNKQCKVFTVQYMLTHRVNTHTLLTQCLPPEMPTRCSLLWP